VEAADRAESPAIPAVAAAAPDEEHRIRNVPARDDSDVTGVVVAAVAASVIFILLVSLSPMPFSN